MARRFNTDDFDAEEEEKRLRETYGRQEHYRTTRADTTHVPQQFLLPSVSDPKLWMVKCKVKGQTCFNSSKEKKEKSSLI
jgi:transcription elongation factor SPT5